MSSFKASWAELGDIISLKGASEDDDGGFWTGKCDYREGEYVKSGCEEDEGLHAEVRYLF